jgi:site-specific recombinase XerD
MTGATAVPADLFFVDRELLLRPSEDEQPPLVTAGLTMARLDRCGLVDGCPFVLDPDGAGGSPFNAYFRMAAQGLAAGSLREYGRDVFRWMAFLRSRERDLLDAGPDDVAAYRRSRRVLQPRPVGKDRWNRELTAIEGFYAWALDEKLIEREPFRWRRTATGRRNLAKERVLTRRSVRHLGVDEFQFFRDVGMRGRTPVGDRDPGCRLMWPQRDGLFADFLVTTGCRLTEGAFVMLAELPEPKEGRSVGSFWLGEHTAKGSRSRRVFVTGELAGRIELYRRGERALAIEAAQPTLRARAGELFVVESVDHDGRGRPRAHGHHRGQEMSVGLGAMTLAQRRAAYRLGKDGYEPLALFVGRGAKVLGRSAWQRTFTEASGRCGRQHGPGMPALAARVTPHVLRHTFAVHMLSELMKVVLQQEADGRSPAQVGGVTALQHLVRNPMLRLQELLGHASVETTYGYLDCLDDSRQLVERALGQWSEIVAALERAG